LGDFTCPPISNKLEGKGDRGKEDREKTDFHRLYKKKETAFDKKREGGRGNGMALKKITA